MFDLLISQSSLTGFQYYTSRQGNVYTLYVKLLPSHNTLDVASRAFGEIGIGVLAESLACRGIKGKPVRLEPVPIGGYLPIASFDGKQESRDPRLRLLSR